MTQVGAVLEYTGRGAKIIGNATPDAQRNLAVAVVGLDPMSS